MLLRKTGGALALIEYEHLSDAWRHGLPRAPLDHSVNVQPLTPLLTYKSILISLYRVPDLFSITSPSPLFWSRPSSTTSPLLRDTLASTCELLDIVFRKHIHISQD